MIIIITINKLNKYLEDQKTYDFANHYEIHTPKIALPKNTKNLLTYPNTSLCFPSPFNGKTTQEFGWQNKQLKFVASQNR
jgi:hypothetical protein